MLNQLEKALQTAVSSCELTIPYFDWTMDTGAMLESPIWRAGLFGGLSRLYSLLKNSREILRSYSIFFR